MEFEYCDYPLPKPHECLATRRKFFHYDYEKQETHFSQLPEILVNEHYLGLTINAIEDYFANPPEDKTAVRTFCLDEFFYVSFKTEVLDFFKLHKKDLVERLTREALILSWRRNVGEVEMQDVQPYMAVKFKVYLFGTDIEYMEKMKKSKPPLDPLLEADKVM